MTHNPLFNYIRHDINHLRNILESQQIHLAETENLQGQKYYRFDLPPKEIQLSEGSHEYLLKEHHISFYQKVCNTNAFLSQCHYTAYFTNEQNELFQLHVYFNSKDQLAEQPSFSLKNTKTNHYQIIEMKSLDEAFISLANSIVLPLVSEIRQGLSRTIKTLESVYIQQEKLASELSEKQDNEPEKYLKALTKVETTLDALIPLVQHNHYLPIKSFISEIKSKVIQYCTQPAITKSSKKRTCSITEPNSLHTKPASSLSTQSLFTKKSNRNTLRHTAISFEAKIAAMNSTLLTLTKANYATQVELIEELHLQMNHLSLLLEDSKQSFQVLKNLATLHSVLHKEGENLLDSLLQHKEFQLAKRLPFFYYHLNANNLSKALQDRNHELLNFLLETGNFIINNQPILFKSKRNKTQYYPSLVRYCYDHNSKQTPMAECLSVVLKHGANLAVPDGQGFPIAQTLIANPNHPLRAVIDENTKETLESINFYKQLIAALKYYLREHEANKKLYPVITEAIESHKLKIEQLNTIKHTGIYPHEQNSNLRLWVQTRQKLTATPIHELERDPEIAAITRKLNEKSEKIISQLAYKQRRAVLKEIHNAFNDCLELSDIIENLSYEEMKQAYLLAADDAFERMTNMELALELNKESLKPHCSHRKASQLTARGKQLNSVLVPSQLGPTNLLSTLSSLSSSLSSLVESIYAAVPNLQSQLTMPSELEEYGDPDEQSEQSTAAPNSSPTFFAPAEAPSTDNLSSTTSLEF